MCRMNCRERLFQLAAAIRPDLAARSLYMFDRRRICILLAGFLPVLLVGCASNYPPTAVIGTWETGIRDKKRTMTFWENGVWTLESRAQNMTGDFKFVSDNQVEIKVDGLADDRTVIFKRMISFGHHDLMHSTDPDTGMRTTWKRVEQQ